MTEARSSTTRHNVRELASKAVVERLDVTQNIMRPTLLDERLGGCPIEQTDRIIEEPRGGFLETTSQQRCRANDRECMIQAI